MGVDVAGNSVFALPTVIWPTVDINDDEHRGNSRGDWNTHSKRALNSHVHVVPLCVSTALRLSPYPHESGPTVMPRLNQFIPALHHALIKARANPPAELSAGVERQVQEYLSSLNDGKVWPTALQTVIIKSQLVFLFSCGTLIFDLLVSWWPKVTEPLLLELLTTEIRQSVSSVLWQQKASVNVCQAVLFCHDMDSLWFFWKWITSNQMQHLKLTDLLNLFSCF